MQKDEFVFKTTELGYTLKLIYDRSGGLTIIRQERTNSGASKHYEIYLSKEAMFSLALKLLKSEHAT